MIQFKKTSKQENEKLFQDYLSSLTSIYEDFLEEHILKSEFYSIYVNEEHCGYFSIFEKTLLTQFYVTKTYLKYAQTIFSEVISQFQIKNAYVPTGDELLLCLAMDKQTKVNLQAYFFVDSQVSASPAVYPKTMLQVATLDDMDEIKQISGDFIDHLDERIKNKQIYVFRDEFELLGLGVFVESLFREDYVFTGMFTNAKFRQKGVGRSIILHLKEIAYEMGKTPIAGCWYYNHNSKKTLESTGYVSKTRLLRIDF